MSKLKSLLLAVVLGCSTCAVQAAGAPARPSTFKQASDAWKKEGLQPVKAAGLDLVFVRKDARLDGYSKVLLKPPVVEVNPDWRNKSGMGGKAPVKVKPVIEQITAMLQEEAQKALTAGGYELVQEPGEGVATVDLTIFNLFLIATEDSVSRGNGIDARSVGRMTLVADVRDSRSDELILRTFDDEVGPKPEQLMRDAVAECLTWARSALAGWSSALRGGLDISSGRKS